MKPKDKDCLHCVISAAIGTFAEERRNGMLDTPEVIISMAEVIGGNRCAYKGDKLDDFDDMVVDAFREIGMDLVRRQ